MDRPFLCRLMEWKLKSAPAKLSVQIKVSALEKVMRMLGRAATETRCPATHARSNRDVASASKTTVVAATHGTRAWKLELLSDLAERLAEYAIDLDRSQTAECVQSLAAQLAETRAWFVPDRGSHGEPGATGRQQQSQWRSRLSEPGSHRAVSARRSRDIARRASNSNSHQSVDLRRAEAHRALATGGNEVASCRKRGWRSGHARLSPRR